jgi:hypothetical protein
MTYLVPLAVRWGIADDAERERALAGADRGQLEELVHCMDQIEDRELDDWLTGPESFRSPPTREYMAMTRLIMAMDLARVLLRRMPS